MTTAILWFRKDLRLQDNPALRAALQNNDCVIPFYCHNDLENKDWQIGEASRWWLHHSLDSLANNIKDLGSRLIIRNGSALKALQQLIKETQATQVYCNSMYEPDSVSGDIEINLWLMKQSIGFHCYDGNTLMSPASIKNKQGQPYRVFTPFYRYYLTHGFETRLSKPPKKLPVVPTKIFSEKVASLDLLPKHQWYKKFERYWKPGETGAKEKLKHFSNTNLITYPDSRDLPGDDKTSKLSPHLHFGEISPRQIIHALNNYSEDSEQYEFTNAYDGFIRQLIWRDFAYYILLHFPHTSEQSFNLRFDKFPWKKADKKFLTAWQKGMTGIPIVDAGMRQLWETGSMHNRVRMIVASLLTKNANLHWQQGARWFWDTLVDADLAQNSMNWQWVAGSGVDAAPYFRIFNPVTQGKRFDPDGNYVRFWVPELKDFPARYIHDPWNATEDLQQQANCIVGKDYPQPILDISQTRQQALENYNNFRQSNQTNETENIKMTL